MASPTCASCSKPIVWADTKNGRRMPLDAKPTQDGEYGLVDGLAFYVGRPPSYKGLVYTSHLYTCVRKPARHG